MQSSNIRRTLYDTGTNEMHVQFRTGEFEYTYKEVPVAVFDGLVKSDSPGRYFHEKVKDKYDFEKREGGRLFKKG